MRVLINALAANSLSGRHVLSGHLANLAKWTLGEHRFDVLYHAGNAELRRDLGPHVEWLQAPDHTRHWQSRLAWQGAALPRLLSRRRVDLVFTTTGGALPRVGVPQVSYAQNPLPLVAAYKGGAAASLKFALQRLSFGMAMRRAHMMFFLSGHLRALYRERTGTRERASQILYVGIDDDTFAAAEAAARRIDKLPYRVLSVSAMAPHKEIETVVRAVHQVRNREGLPLELKLVGPWSDPRYLQTIRRLIAELALEDHVAITGAVTREHLHRHYAEASLFCLMSRSESFGIPAVEAQAFATPVVSASGCAAPEVCGKGGRYAAPGDVERVAGLMAELLSDRATWNALSNVARANARRFRWERCSRPILRMFDGVACP